MKFTLKPLQQSLRAAGLIAVAAIGLHSVNALAAAEVIEIDGSSTVYPLTEAVAEEFQGEYGTRVTVGISGTGGGFKRFCRGETDIAEASRPILKEEMVACAQAGIKYFEIPVAYDALTIVANPAATFLDQLTIDELKKIWEPGSKINNWNQVRASFPNQPLKLAGPGADSGTFDYFTEAVVGRSKASRGDYQASEDDNVVVQFVARDKGAMGYFGLAYYEENMDKLKAVPVVSPKGGQGVLPSVDTVLDGSYNPLSRPMFIYVKQKSVSRPAVRQFVEFYLDNAGELAREVGYVNLPDADYATAKQRFADGVLGTGFGGTPEVGIRVEDLLKRQPKM